MRVAFVVELVVALVVVALAVATAEPITVGWLMSPDGANGSLFTVDESFHGLVDVGFGATAPAPPKKSPNGSSSPLLFVVVAV